MVERTGWRWPWRQTRGVHSSATGGLSQWLHRASTYHFRDRWQVDGELSEISHVFFHCDTLPDWWAQFRSVATMSPGDSIGLGRLIRTQIKGYLPYRLEVGFRVINVQYPEYFEVQVEGDFDGCGRGHLRQSEGLVEIELHLEIRVRRKYLQILSVVARPLLVAQHVWTMGQGRIGLNREILRRRLAEPATPN